MIAIATGEILAGALPGRPHRFAREWSTEHRDEFEANWRPAFENQQPPPIDPLR